MNRRSIYSVMLACAVLIAITVLLRLFGVITWAGIFWAIATSLGLLAGAFLAYFAYVIVSLESGYKTEDETSRRMRSWSSDPLHPLQAWLHLRIARHR